jgi:type III secretory pathway component EscS
MNFANSLPCSCGSSGHKPQLMTLAYQRFTAMLLLIYDSLFLSGVCYCLSVFCCAVTSISERTLNFLLHLARVEAKSRRY